MALSVLASCKMSDTTQTKTDSKQNVQADNNTSAEEDIPQEPAVPTAVTATATPEPTPVPTKEPELYTFNPHVYSEKLSEIHNKKWWKSFYNLVDAVRNGEDSFECHSKKAYDEIMDSVTLGDLYPVACVWVTGESNDGTVPYEDGIGRIYYTIPKKKFMKKLKKFETEIERMLAESGIKDDYTDFEKCLAMYDYMTSHFEYDYDRPEFHYGANYRTLMKKKGICCDIGGAYAYMLMQCQVDALEIQSYDDIYHAWTYVIIDGKGYHADATWGLRSEDTDLCLKYFMETDKERANDGFDISTLKIPLFMDVHGDIDKSVKYKAKDKKYSKLWEADYLGIDREKKVISCRNVYTGEEFEFSYE